MSDTAWFIGEIIVGLAILIVIIALLAVWFLRLPTRMSALDLLQERYARGELPRDKYIQMRDDLEASSGASLNGGGPRDGWDAQVLSGSR